jgi:hypothetical protein
MLHDHSVALAQIRHFFVCKVENASWGAHLEGGREGGREEGGREGGREEGGREEDGRARKVSSQWVQQSQWGTP